MLNLCGICRSSDKQQSLFILYLFPTFCFSEIRNHVVKEIHFHREIYIVNPFGILYLLILLEKEDKENFVIYFLITYFLIFSF